ncbi:MAG TPA: immunoglobulin domain-containing protein [Opitutaceae bacterium]|jgi:hypothetical protein
MRSALPRAWLAAVALGASLAAPASAQEAGRKQEIVLGELPELTVGDAPFEIGAKATSGLQVTVQIVAGPAALEGKKIRLTGQPGLVVVRVSQAGNADWLPARDVERAFTVRAHPSPPVFLSSPTGRDAGIGEHVVLFVDASGEPAPALQWRKNRIPIPGATGRTYEILAAVLSDAGSYDVVATNGSGEATSVPARINVTKRQQSILFQPGATSVPAGQIVALNAAATSGLPVHYTLVSGVGSVSGGTLSSPGGTVVVQAEQPGDATYEAALPVSQTFLFTTALGGAHPP